MAVAASGSATLDKVGRQGFPHPAGRRGYTDYTYLLALSTLLKKPQHKLEKGGNAILWPMALRVYMGFDLMGVPNGCAGACETVCDIRPGSA